MQSKPEALARAKELLTTARHAAMATVNEDGSPHNTPYHFLIDEKFEYCYWVSQPEALHSKNVERTGQAFTVIYDAQEKGGVYMRLEDCLVLSGDDIDKGLAVHNAERARAGKEPIPRSYYGEGNSHKMYRGKAAQFWVYVVTRDPETGFVTKDAREEVSVGELLAA